MASKLLRNTFAHVHKLAAVQTRRGLADRELLEQFVDARDEHAFTVLVERHGPMVLGVCRRALGNAHDAEDACQATFLVLAQSAASVRKVSAVKSWLHGVACRVAANLKRERFRRCRREREVQTPASPDPPAEVSWREVQAVLDEELRRLPEGLRAPLILCYLDGRTRDEAARQLRLSVGCLHGRLERGRRLLGERLRQRGLTFAAALSATALGESVSRAALSPTMVLSTTRAAVLFAGGQAIAQNVLPTNVLSLTQEVLKSMFLTKLKLGLLAFLGAGLLLAAVGGAFQLGKRSAERGTNEEFQVPDSEFRVGEGPPDADGRPLPEGAVRRLGSRRFRVEGRNGFALPTPDGKHILVQPQPLLSAYAAQGLVLLDAETGLRVRTFEDSRRVPKLTTYEAIRPAAFSPDGTKLYALGWHPSEKDGNAGAQWASLDNPCKRVLFVWDVATGKRTAEWQTPSSWWSGSSLFGVSVSPDGKRLYLYGAVRMETDAERTLRGVHGVHVLEAATGKLVQTWNGAGYPAGWTAGGKEVVTFRRGAAVTAHEAETGKPVRTFPLGGFIPSVVLSPDGTTVAAVGVAGQGGQRTCEIKIWEADTGREVRRLPVDGPTVGDSSARLLFAPDGKTLYLGTGSGRILRWDLSAGRALPDWPAHSGMVRDLFFRPGTNELVSAAYGGAVRRWDAATGKPLSAADSYVGDVAFARTPDAKGLVAVDATGRLDVWDAATGRVTKTLQTPGRQNHELLFTPDGGHLLVAAQTGPNTVWDLSAGKQVGAFAPPPKKDPKADEYWWGTLGFSPDGRRLAASKFGRGTWVWAWPEKTVLWHDAKEQEGCSFPDGERLICGAWHGDVQFRDPQTGALKGTASGPGLTRVAFSPDRRRMVTAHLDGAWRVRDGATGAVLKEVKGFQHVWCVAFSPSGWLLAVAGDRSVRVYDTASWQEVARFAGHDGTVRSVFFGPDAATLVSASSEDGTALVWSLKPPAGRKPDLAELWADLAGAGPEIRRAVWAAAQHPDAAIRLFREKWPLPQSPTDPKHVAGLIADLDSAVFANREAATAGLEKFGRRVEAELRKVAAESASAEARRRAEAILARWAPPESAEYPAEDARELRAVWALELAGTAEARKVLAEWAAAKVGNRLCEEAAAALKRLQRKR